MQKLMQSLGYTYTDLAFLELALTHRSVGAHNNERLEFLGDSVINFIIADELYAKFPKASEGQLTRMRAQLVCAEMLTEIAKKLELGKCIILGSGERRSGGHQRSSILADTLEAIVGSIYLDCGMQLPLVKTTILEWYKDHMHMFDDQTAIGNKDPKTVLQELMQSKKLELPCYTVVRIEGEQHDQTFYVECTVALLPEATTGVGNSRRKAEQMAAEQVLEKLQYDKR